MKGGKKMQRNGEERKVFILQETDQCSPPDTARCRSRQYDARAGKGTGGWGMAGTQVGRC